MEKTFDYDITVFQYRDANTGLMLDAQLEVNQKCLNLELALKFQKEIDKAIRLLRQASTKTGTKGR